MRNLRYKKGSKDLSLFASPDFTAPTGDTLGLNIGLGMFIADNLSLRATLTHDVQEDIAPGGADYRATDYNLGVEYHFDLGFDLGGSIIPYVGADLGWRRSKFGSIRDDGVIYGPRVGVKYFLADNVAIDASLSYRFSGADVYISDFEFESHKILFGIGLRIMF
jgi:opacity protein-like surface antigen